MPLLQNIFKPKRTSYNQLLSAVTFDETELKILPYNRVVRDLNQLTVNEFLDQLSNTFKIDKMNGNSFLMKILLLIYLENTWYQIKLKEILKILAILQKLLIHELLKSIF